MHHQRPVARAAVWLALAAFASALPSTSAAQSTLKLGWLSSLTGPLSSAAIAENQGVQFAVDEINKAGGINGQKIELITRDTAGDPTKAVNFAKQLIFVDKVSFIIGPVNSGESLATVPIVSKAEIPNLIIGTVDELVDPVKYPRAFRVINTNKQWIEAANDYALNVLKKKKIAVIGDTSGYGTSSAKTAAELLEKSGVKPVYSVLIDPNKTDLTDEMNKAKAAGADVLMPWSAATGLLARMLNTRGDMGWNVAVVGHPALMAPPLRKLLNKPEFLDNAFASGYTSMTYDAKGKLPERTHKLQEAIRGKLAGGRHAFPEQQKAFSALPPIGLTLRIVCEHLRQGIVGAVRGIGFARALPLANALECRVAVPEERLAFPATPPAVHVPGRGGGQVMGKDEGEPSNLVGQE